MARASSAEAFLIYKELSPVKNQPTIYDSHWKRELVSERP
jgi:hypothetical protein